MFDLQKCINGEPVIELESYHKFHFIAYNKLLLYPLIMAKGGTAYSFSDGGVSSHGGYVLQMAGKIQKVDLSKLPVDTIFSTPDGLVHFCRANQDGSTIEAFTNGRSSVTNMGRITCTWNLSEIHLHTEQPWIPQTSTFRNPLPDGLGYEILRANHNKIIAYRLTGQFFDNWSF